MAVPILWKQAIMLADFYREVAKSQRDPLKKSILRLASTVLEDLSDELTYGYVRGSTRKKLEYVRKLLESSNLPHYSLDKLIERVSRKYRSPVLERGPALEESWTSEYIVGLA